MTKLEKQEKIALKEEAKQFKTLKEWVRARNEAGILHSRKLLKDASNKLPSPASNELPPTPAPRTRVTSGRNWKTHPRIQFKVTQENALDFYYALLLCRSEERLRYIFELYPELKNETHQNIADVMGLERETVTRMMNKMGYRRQKPKEFKIPKNPAKWEIHETD